MKKFIVAALVASSMLATPAFAATANDSFVINASVSDVCAIENIADVNLGNQAVSSVAGAGALQLLGNDFGQSNGFYVSCNLPASVQVTSAYGALLNTQRSVAGTGADAALFTDRLNYQVAVAGFNNNGVSGANPRLNTATQGTTGTALVSAPFHKQVNMNVLLLASENPLRPLAGNYQDTVTVTLTSL